MPADIARLLFERHARGIAGAVVLLAGTTSVLAQGSDTERRIERAIRQIETEEMFRVDTSLDIAERSILDFGGTLSFFGLHLTEGNGESRRLLQPELSLYGRAVIDGAHSFFVHSRFQYRDFSNGDSFDGKGDRFTEPFLDRYWYEFDYQAAVAAYEGRSIDGTVNIRIGRQFVDWGQGLALSEQLYAATPTIRVGKWSLEGVIGQTPSDESITDFDSSRDDYNTDTRRGFVGGLLRYDTRVGHQFYVYGLQQLDNNNDTESAVPLGVPIDFEYNSTYIGVGAEGSISTNWLYGAEFVYELGDSRSDPLRGLQESEDISAFAGRFVLTYLFRDTGQSRVDFETLFASGDDDRLSTTNTVGGNAPGTNDTAFNSLGFVNTGLAFSPSLSNLLAFRVGGSTLPFAEVEGLDQLQLTLDVFLFNKFDTDAPIEEPTTDDMFLGTEVDVGLNWRLTSDLALTARYGVFFAGPAIADGNDDVRHFVFGGVTLSF